MIRLSIKGTKQAATRAAKKRGIPVRKCSVGKRNIVFCDTPCDRYMDVAKWYAEPTGEAKPGYGYKAGTLVFFSPKDCD
jgi:hypothetical protein